MSSDRSHEHAIRLLAGAFGPEPPTDDQMSAYLVALAGLDGDAVFDAVVHLIRTVCSGMPSAGAVRAAVLVGDVPDALEAWLEVTAMVRTVGYLRRPVFSHWLTARAVEALGGWETLCASEDLDATEARFRDVFTVLARRAVREWLASTEGVG